MNYQADDLLSPEAYNKLRTRYWVLAWKAEDRPPCWWNWVFSLSEPSPVPNSRMYWRRPTYAEAVQREIAYRDRSDYLECIEKYGKLGKYRRAEGVPCLTS